jgi:hypothetical protein
MAKRGIELEGTAKKVGTKRVPLNEKQQKFLDGVYKQRLSEYEAAKRAGFSERQARNVKDKIWTQRGMQNAYAYILEHIDHKMLLRNIDLGLNAMSIQYVGKEGRPEINLDLKTRLEYMKYIARLQGMDKDEVDVNHKGTINFIMPKE